MRLILLTCAFLLTLNGWAQGPLPQSPSPEILRQISEHNKKQAEFESQITAITSGSQQVVPFAEYEETGYVFFNDDDFYGYAREIKRTIAKNLPAGVTLVVYTTSQREGHVQELKEKYSSFIAEEQLIILKVPRSGSNNFWTRDNLPVPVWTDDQFTLVDAQYYYNFEPDDFLIELFSSLSTAHSYFFEGGNFIANSRGECIVVNRRRSYPGGVSDTAAIPDNIFRVHYGCKKLTRLKHLKGIGHSDEVVKFMSDDVVVTDTHDYVPKLRQLGYKVHMLPEPDRNYETYVNSLQVNDILFVPTFGESHDNKAIKVYRDLNLGLKIVPIPARQLATRGQGGIHCITMNYPPVPFEVIERALGVNP